MTQTIVKKIEVIDNMFRNDRKRNIFKKHIDYIRFPFFKNFEEGLKVNFDFPIVFLTGTNGTGKSSVLHALYGSPNNSNISDFWFNTALDPINNIGENRHCFICGFTTEFTKSKAEIIKTRIKRDDKKTGKIDFDYWEPSRPIKKYGMEFNPSEIDEREATQTRWRLQNRKVYYMDFRYSLSAFDKFFYFGAKPRVSSTRTKQDVIRKHATRLKSSFEKNNIESYYKRKTTKPIKFSEEAIKVICYILDKSYVEAKMLEHDFYDNESGFAIRYITNELKYSEAFAGSGEIAITKLVNDLLTVEPHSLILLDEPETSLHPSAQKKLIEFIVDQIKKKKLQVVISTHSPDILEGMPSRAINVLYENPTNRKISVHENVHPNNAFIYIGHSITNKKKIIVEDELAKLIVESVINNNGDSDLFEVSYSPGGESRIKQENIVVYSKTKDLDKFIIFDGDQRFDAIDLDAMSENNRSLENLRELVISSVGQSIKFSIDSNSDKSEQEKSLLELYISYLHSNVFFLPKDIPEEIIWNDQIAKSVILDESVLAVINAEENFKKKFNLVADTMFGDTTSSAQLNVYKYFINQWKNNTDSKEYKEITSIINAIKEI